MKKLSTIFLILLSALSSYAQRSAISNDKQNIVYVGLENPLTVSVERYGCKSVILQTKDGELRKDEDCHYSLMVREPGTIIIEVGVKENGKIRVIGQMPFRAKLLPDPTARINGKPGGSMPLNQFKVQIGLTVDLGGFDIEAHFKVTEFYMVVIRSNKVIFAHAIKGSVFDDTFNYFKTELTRGDRVIFSNIHCIGPDGKDRHIAPTEFVLE